MDDDNGRKRSEAIERDIEDTSRDIHETVDALERKLSPGALVDEVWHRIRNGSSGGATSGIAGAVRDHPGPVAFMGAGVAWLAIEYATGSTKASDREGSAGGVRTSVPGDGLAPTGAAG